MNGEPVETGMFGVGHDSQQVFVEPRVDRTHHRVVVRVHLVAGGVFPSLPQRRRAGLEHVSPTGIGRLGRDSVGGFGVAVAR